MVNTVGSCENKHWQKRWITIKKSLVLTTKQRSLIIGSLLGDGTMRPGRKIIPIKITEYLNPFALAIWIMDDGSYSNKKIDISTYSFSLHEINILQECLKNNFGIIAKYYRDRNKGYRMYFNQEETKKLVKITYPYISRILSMTYKVGIHNPVTTGFLPFAKKAG